MTISLALRRMNAYAPWSPSAWRNTTFAAAGVPVQFAAPTVVGWPWIAWVPVSSVAVLATLTVSAIPLLAWSGGLSSAQQQRFWALLGERLPRPQQAGRALSLTRLRSESTWRQIGYHVVAGPLIAIGGLVTILAWATGAGMAAVYLYSWALPHGSAVGLRGHAVQNFYISAAGALLLLAAPLVAAATVAVDRRAALRLLGPSRERELERRVESLTESRAGVVDAADAERRRIERDLHDGAQRRLVSLALNLGLAKETLTGVPADAMEVIDAAHEEAKEALAELRNLVRGLHPAVLDDRGLDAALSGISASAPLPVRLRVDLPERASPTVEAVAYFVASEALTNVSKHAHATQMEIFVERRGELLHMTVSDDGVGGADAAHGSGLTGLARRVASVDGTFRIASPAGGPTVITVELPCES